jgi:hypothetical protein
VFSAQAWHWVVPGARYTRAREALEEGGALAVFWNRPVWDESPLREELRAAYESRAPEFGPDPGPMHPGTTRPELRENWEREIESAPGFEHPEVRFYRWSREYTSDGYLQLLRTHSDHIVLEPSSRDALLAAIREVIERSGGTIKLEYVTKLCLGRASR